MKIETKGEITFIVTFTESEALDIAENDGVQGSFHSPTRHGPCMNSDCKFCKLSDYFRQYFRGRRTF